MPGNHNNIDENYDEYEEVYSESKRAEIQKAIDTAKEIDYFNSELDQLKYNNVLSWKTIDFKTPDSINNFYRIENWKIVFQLDQIKNYLNDVYKRLSWMKSQRFQELSKEKNFTWTILAIQIALKAFWTDPKNPKTYNFWPINWEYNESTKFAINQFQTDCKLQWKDGKPWKETIWRIVNELDNLINNKKLERSEQEILRDDIQNIIEESIIQNRFSWIYTEEDKENMVNYIINWDLNSGKNELLETKIKNLSNNISNYKLKYLIEHSNESLEINMQNIRERENKNEVITPRTFNKYTSWENLTQWQRDAMANKLQQLWSPITVQMVEDSCKKTNVPVEYLLAFMQNDSRLGTNWKRAINNHNPWNVWNTDNGKNKYYASREEWVLWCAEHLRDRISAYRNKYKKFPTVNEIAKWVWFKGVYMTAEDWPKNVNINLKNRVNRLRWK